MRSLVEFDLIHNIDFENRNKRQHYTRSMPGFDELLAKQRSLSADFADWCSMPILTRKQEVYLFRQYKYSANLMIRLAKEKGFGEQQRDDRKHGESGMRFMGKAHRLAKRAWEVRDASVCCNMRLVVSFYKKKNLPPACFLEKVSDGYTHMLHGLEKFDYNRGNKFSTYCSWVLIKNNMRDNVVDNQKASRLTYLDPNIIVLNLDPTERSSTDPSLRSQEEDGQNFITRLFQVAELSEREQLAILGNLGIYEEKTTLEELGKTLQVTKERVRQIKNNGIKKLRNALEAV